MAQTIQVYKPKSGVAKSAREVAPIAAIEEQYSKLEQELMDPKAAGGKVIEIVMKIDEYKGQLEEFSKNIKNGGARKYLDEVKKYGESLIHSYGVPYLKVLYNNLLSQISAENIQGQKKTIEVIGNLLKKYGGK